MADEGSSKKKRKRRKKKTDDRPAQEEMVEEGIHRRDFFAKIGWGAFWVYLAAMGGCFARFFFPRVLFEPPTVFSAGVPADYSIGQVSTRYKAEHRVWIVRDPSKIFAIYAKCTHLGCTPNWSEARSKFKCPCHGSGYTKDGINFEGPAPRPMDRCQVDLSPDGKLLVDTSQLYPQPRWDAPGAAVEITA